MMKGKLGLLEQTDQKWTEMFTVLNINLLK